MAAAPAAPAAPAAAPVAAAAAARAAPSTAMPPWQHVKRADGMDVYLRQPVERTRLDARHFVLKFRVFLGSLRGVWAKSAGRPSRVTSISCVAIGLNGITTPYAIDADIKEPLVNHTMYFTLIGAPGVTGFVVTLELPAGTRLLDLPFDYDEYYDVYDVKQPILKLVNESVTFDEYLKRGSLNVKRVAEAPRSQSELDEREMEIKRAAAALAPPRKITFRASPVPMLIGGIASVEGPADAKVECTISDRPHAFVSSPSSQHGVSSRTYTASLPVGVHPSLMRFVVDGIVYD